jgi:hypothetical protein
MKTLKLKKDLICRNVKVLDEKMLIKLKGGGGGALSGAKVPRT